jgi:signal transduction histidine kinase/ligand-binding sensor domain-containing protein
MSASGPRRSSDGRAERHTCRSSAARRLGRLGCQSRFLGLLLTLGLMAGSVQAQHFGAKRYLIDVWPGDKGLPQNTITGIAQTQDGYLWISTLDGVARFDGVHFKMFKAGDTPALGSGRIRFLFTGRHGELRLATQEGGVIQFASGRFTPLPLLEPQGIRSAVSQVAEEESGALWLSLENGKVGRFADGRYTTVSTNWAVPGNTGFEVRADYQNRLWVLSAVGLHQLAGERLVPALVGQPGEYVVHCASHGGGWWLSAKGRVRLWREGQWLAEAGSPGVSPADITCGLEDRAGHVWLGTTGQGLLLCATNHAPVPFTKRDRLSSDSVRTLFEDGEGDLWVGTEDGGLDRLCLPLFRVYGVAQGLTSERITTVSEGATGQIWAGTDGYGLNCLEGDSARLATEDTAAASWRVSAAVTDNAGELWVALRAGGVFRGKPGQLKQVVGFPTVMFPTRSLFQDSHGAVWIGQRNSRKLTRVQGDTPITIDLPGSMPLADVRAMAEDAAGNLWFGTDGAGLLRWKEGQFTRFTREQGLSSDYVWALHPEPDGALWIGTYGGGLTRLKEGRAAICSARHGLVDDVICHIADDGRGQYWFSSNQGIFRVSKTELNQFADGKRPRIQCVGYGRSDGLPALECEGGCQPAGCRSRDGRLWFPTIRGLVVVDPAEVDVNPAPPPVYIEAVLVDGEVVSSLEAPEKPEPRAERTPGSQPSGVLNQERVAFLRQSSGGLQLPPGKKRFEFHYTGLNFRAPEQLRFRHKLEGVDAEWVDTGNQREASYDKLAPGTYRFRVQACNREGVWNQAGDMLAFTVLPHFWQSGWFMGLFLAGFGSGVGLTVRYALRRRHQRQMKLMQQLNAVERERTRIARDIHDDLGASLTEIGYMGALAVRDSKTLQEAREQFGRIMVRTRELARSLDETVWSVNPKNDSPGHLATYLCHMAREFLEPTAIRCRLDVAPELPEVTLTAELRHNMLLVVKECLNNAVKHSGATELWLRLKVQEGVLAIEVSDNGHGFVLEAVREEGNGLRNMASRMQEIGGQFQVRSAPGQGTVIRLRLPLPEPAARGQPAGRPIRMGDGRNG